MWIRNRTIASVAGLAVAFGAYCWRRQTRLEQEVAERKKAQEVLRQNELHLRALVANAPAILFALDGDGVFTASEGQGLEAFGREQNELVGQWVFDLYRDKPMVLKLARCALAGEELDAAVSSGGMTLRARTTSPRDGTGKVSGVVGIAMDVTGRKQAAEVLRKSEERYRRLVERTTDGIFLADFGTKGILESNAALQDMLGYTAEELVGMSLYELLDEDPESIDRSGQRTLKERGFFVGELRYRRKDGSLVDGETSATVIPYGDREGLCCIVRDISERKRAEEELKEANRRLNELAVLKSAFSSMVAHELYSPLVAARGYLDMLATGELGPDEQEHVLDGMRSELEMLSALVADARIAGNIEQEDFAVQPRKIPVGTLLDDAVAFAGMLPGEHRIIVKAGVREQDVWADQYRIGQVLRNLLSNAAKYSPDGAAIELRAVTCGDHVRIEVADRGPGIHLDDAVRIFEKFGRGRDPSGHKVAGVGLGLYLSRRIMKAHGGDLMLDSTPGVGSVFAFELRIAR